MNGILFPLYWTSLADIYFLPASSFSDTILFRTILSSVLSTSIACEM